MEYFILPKLLGLAERAWAQDPDWALEENAEKSAKMYQTAWSEFINSAGKRELPRLDYYAGGFKYRIPAPGAVVQNGAVIANIQIPGLILRYTTNGTSPSRLSKIYTAPVKTKGTIKITAFNATGRSGKTVTVYN